MRLRKIFTCRIFIELPDWSAVSRLKNPFFFRKNTDPFLLLFCLFFWKVCCRLLLLLNRSEILSRRLYGNLIAIDKQRVPQKAHGYLNWCPIIRWAGMLRPTFAPLPTFGKNLFSKNMRFFAENMVNSHHAVNVKNFLDIHVS
jgi:hypothetical protein